MDATTSNAPSPPARIDLGLTGMTCAACAARIEKVLNRVPGAEATVNFATETAAVGYDPRQVAPEQLIAAVARAGYGATVRSDPEGDRRRDKARKAAEFAQLKREFIVAALLTAPLLAQMIPMLASGSLTAAPHADLLPRWLQLALATPVQFWIGRRFYVGAFNALRGGGANMDVLVALGTTMAYAFSAVVTLFGLHDQHVYFEAGAAVITLVLLGKLLEARAKAGTSAALEGAAAPAAEDRARGARRRDRRGAARATAWPATVFVVRAGESMPVDGIVHDGDVDGRREHADGREPAGREGARRAGVRGHAQPGRSPDAATPPVWAAPRCWRASCAWSPRRRARRRRSSGWPIAWPACSSRSSWWRSR